MKPVDQTILTFPGGNCFSACVASILEMNLDDVPYFMEPEDWLGYFNKWLRPLGFYAIDIPLNGSDWRPEGYYILSGESPRNKDYDHSTVALGNKIVHDPHPSKDNIKDEKFATILIQLDPSKVIKNETK